MTGTITTIETFGDLADDGYGLNIDCNSCGVHRAVDPACLPREHGYGTESKTSSRVEPRK